MSAPSEIQALRDRSSVGWLRERDIDLLLCAELHAAGPLRDRFASLWPNDQVQFVGAWVSHTEINGETDLVVEFQSSVSHHVVFVENKIAANFQPNQATRYAERAARWRRNANVKVRTVLICPREYLLRPTSEEFDATITYEDLIEALRSSRDERSIFLARALADGIDSYRRGYVAIPDQAVTSVWETIWRTALSDHPSLNMEKPAEKPGNSGWVYFRRPSGFMEADTKRCVIVYKASRGQVDLQFKSMTASQLEGLVGALIEPDMSVVKASKSASVRVLVPDIDFSSAAEPQIESICIGLHQAERLRRFFLDKGVSDRLRSSHPM